MNALSFDALLEKGIELALGIAPNVLAVIALLVGGWWLSKWAKNAVARWVESNPEMDQTLKGVLSKGVGYLIFIVLFIAALSQLGIQTTSILAALGAAGLAIGLALQGTLSNIAAGIMLLWLRPFGVGDIIDSGSAAGRVEEIGLFATRLRSPDGIYAFVPNSELWNKKIDNFSRNPTRRVRLQVGIGYEDDIEVARNVFKKLVASDDRVLAEPAPAVIVSDLGDNSVVVELRVWTDPGSYWDVLFDFRERAKIELENAGVSIPFPQRTLHVESLPADVALPTKASS